MPVAWHIVGAHDRESWIDHFCRLLRLLAPAVPATVPVHVLCDQGLGSRDLWAQIVALGWHPCLRYQPHITFQPAGQSQRVPVRSLITGPGDLWVGAGRAFRDAPLESTLIVLHAFGQAQPWALLTDTPVAQTEPTLYACSNWIEQGFRGLKTVGDPCMVGEGSSPWLRYPPHVTFQPRGQTQRVPVRTLIAGTGRPVGGHRASLPRPASGRHLDGVARLRSDAALGAADRHPGGADGAHPVCLPQLD